MMDSETALRGTLAAVAASLQDSLAQIEAAKLAADAMTTNRALHAIKGYVPIFASDALVADLLPRL